MTLRIEAGERVALVGPNAAGKTTLLRVVAGLRTPDAGEVEVFGLHPRDRSARARVGLVAHQSLLYPHLTPRENLRLWARLYGVPDTQADGLLERLGVSPAERRPVSRLSQGTRRRASLARALVHSPALLLADEPFAGLDDSGAEAARGVIVSAGCAALIATHQLERAADICSRVAALQSGHLIDAAHA